MPKERGHHHLADYYGYLKNGRMEGEGVYWFDTQAKYHGQFKDGMFHGKGSIYFSDGAKYESTWEKGLDQGGTYEYNDGSACEGDDDALTGWRYCNPVMDRRFHKEITGGLRPVNKCMLAADCDVNGHPLHKIPPDCFDVGDGYYDPNERVVYGYSEKEDPLRLCEVLRYVTEPEHHRIVSRCRRGYRGPVGRCKAIEPNEMAALSDEAGQLAIAKIIKRSTGMPATQQSDSEDALTSTLRHDSRANASGKRVSFDTN